MLSPKIEKILKNKKFGALTKACEKEDREGSHKGIVKWFYEKHPDFSLEEITEILEEMGFYTSDDVEDIIKDVSSVRNGEDSRDLILRLLSRNDNMVRREIVQVLVGRYKISETMAYRVLSELVDNGSIYLYPDKTFSLRPYRNENPICMSSAVINEMLEDTTEGIEVLPFKQLNLAVGGEIGSGVQQGESVLYIAPGNSGKTSFLFQTMAECMKKQIDTIYVATIEGGPLNILLSCASIKSGKRVNRGYLKQLKEASEKGDKEAKAEFESYNVFDSSHIQCWHYLNNPLSPYSLLKNYNAYKATHEGRTPKVLIFDYLKDSYVRTQYQQSYGEFSKAILDILSFCKQNNLIFITAAQDPGQTDRKKDIFDFPDAPSLYGARNATDAFQVVLWQQGSILNHASGNALNRVKVQKTKYGTGQPYVLTKVDTRSYRALDSKGPFYSGEEKSLMRQAEAQMKSSVDFSDIEIAANTRMLEAREQERKDLN